MKRKAWIAVLAVLLASNAATAADAAFTRALREAQAGDARQQYAVGIRYLFGQGTKADAQEGARWLESSARLGVPQAKTSLATLYDIGHGVSLDTAKATRLRQEAANAGESLARSQIDLDRKISGTHDYRRADALWDFRRYADAFPYAKRAAEAGNPEGQELLGKAYLQGFGTRRDYAEAIRWFEKSDAAGWRGGTRALGHVYEFGKGVPVDRRRALQYYDRAAARGSAVAKQAAANLRSPDYNPPAPPAAQGTPTFCSGGFIWDVGMGYCRPRFENDSPNSPTQWPP